MSMSQPASRYFSHDETQGLDPRLLALLDHARGLAKIPFVITSGARTPEQNSAAGGVQHSAHERGLAVDIACTGSHARMRIVAAAIKAGFRRIGAYDRHVHLDCDETLPQEVLWVGESH